MDCKQMEEKKMALEAVARLRAAMPEVTFNADFIIGFPGEAEEEFLERYEYLTKALINSPYVCGFCYTQLYDVEQEVNGLYTYERQAKFDMNKIKAITQAKKEK